MTYEAAWLNFLPDGSFRSDGMVVATPGDVDTLVAKLTDPAADTATIYLTNSAVFGSPPMIDHTVHAVVAADRGYLSYWDTTHELAFSSGDPASAAYESEAEDFPSGGGLPLDTFITALRELLATGQRPTVVDWRSDADSVSGAGGRP